MSLARPLIITGVTCLLSVASLGWLVLCIASMPNSRADTADWIAAFGPLVGTTGVWLVACGAWIRCFQARPLSRVTDGERGR